MQWCRGDRGITHVVRVWVQGYQLGETKVFLRAGQMASLDKLRTELMNRCAITIQRHVQGFVKRRQYARTRNAAITVQVNLVQPEFNAGSYRFCSVVSRPRPSSCRLPQITHFVSPVCIGLIV